jgi:urea carboxylase
MEGPGGYQFVGRTVPVWNRFRRTSAFSEPWLLRTFDQLQFFEVGADELLDWRRDLLTGQAELEMATGTLRLADYLAFCEEHAPDIVSFRQRQQAAFNEERSRWASAETSGPDVRILAEDEPEVLPPGTTLVETALLASVWKVVVEAGQHVDAGDALVVLESMKMETTVHAPVDGRVARVMVRSGQEVVPGQPLVAIAP